MSLLTRGQLGWTPVAVLAAARTVPGAVIAVGALAAVPSVAVAVDRGRDFTGALLAASLIAGAGAGYATEDPAARTLASSPTTLAVRRSLRAVTVLAILLSAWAAAQVVVAAHGAPASPIGHLAAELAASAALSLAIASYGGPDSPVATGAGATAGAVLAMLVISSLARSWPALPAIGNALHHERWWWVAAAGVTAAAWSWRDPAAGSRRLRCARPLGAGRGED